MTGSRQGLRVALVVIEVLVAVNAVFGGVGLMTSGMGMPTAWLAGTPFTTWVLPGVALLVLVAVPQLWGAWTAWRRHRLAPLVAMAVGGALSAWIIVQIALLQQYFFLQPIIAGIGLLETYLGWRWWSSLKRTG